MARIFGVFLIETKITRPVTVLLMQNVLQLENPKNLKYVFDLKGSRVNREVFVDDKKASSSTTLKDLNFLKI